MSCFCASGTLCSIHQQSCDHALLRITLSGARIALASDFACAASTAGTTFTCTAALVSSVLTVKLTAGTYTGRVAITFTITKFTTQTAGQALLANIAAGTSAEFTASPVVILDTTNLGTFPAIPGLLLFQYQPVHLTPPRVTHHFYTCLLRLYSPSSSRFSLKLAILFQIMRVLLSNRAVVDFDHRQMASSASCREKAPLHHSGRATGTRTTW
jgi:hypothetical protein